MTDSGLSLVPLTTAALILALVHVCNSFAMDAWVRAEWNRLMLERERVRKARARQHQAETRLATLRATLTDLQMAASRLERRARSLTRIWPQHRGLIA